MDKQTILAVVLITIIISVSMVIQSTFFPPQTVNNSSKQSTEQSVNSETEQNEAVATASSVSSSNKASAIVSITDNPKEKFKFETDLYEIEFDTVGASISSLMMKEHEDADGERVDLVFRGPDDHNAFLMYWGDDYSSPVMDAFAVSVDGQRVIFTNQYRGLNGDEFTVRKTFEFKNGEYLFAVNVDILTDGKSVSSATGLDGTYIYTLAYEPQVGPSFTQMKNSAYDYRRVYVDEFKKNGKLKTSMARLTNGLFYTTTRLQWIELTSKYFTVVAMPQDNTISYKYATVRGATDSVTQTDSLFISRPTDSSINDTFYFYAGPQLKKFLGSYYSGMDNAWGIRESNLDDAMESGSMLGWLENVLKWILNLLYKVIPNYGVGIILLTIIIKLLLWPLSKKSLSSTAKITALQPQLKEIQEKYKDNPQRMNQETAALYKEAGASPLGGCLPMILQFPILFAMYGLLNKHFELRGAMFIPGWIPDLSVPETVASLNFNIPLLGNEIHLLPIFYTLSMIFSMKITQTQSSEAQGGFMMKFMSYGMPIIFFFVLYSAPSGLLLYWSAQNVLSMIQQFYTNMKLKKNPNAFADDKKSKEKQEPEAVRKYQEKLKRIEENKAKEAKVLAKSSSQGKGKKK